MDKIVTLLAKELRIQPRQAQVTLELLDGGNTVPFIARYRKERTGSLDEEQIRQVEARAQYLRNLEKRRAEILQSVAGQGKLTPGLEQQLQQAVKMQELEDLYLPYRPKKQTKARLARQKGLEPLAGCIVLQQDTKETPAALGAAFVDPGKDVPDAAAAWQGALWIVAEDIADEASLRALARKTLWDGARLTAELMTDERAGTDFLLYKEYSEAVRQIPPHRILALNRGERLKHLKVSLAFDEEALVRRLCQALHVHALSPAAATEDARAAAAKIRLDAPALAGLPSRDLYSLWYRLAVADACRRLIVPSLEREIRNELTEKADKQAISVFSANLRQLLLQQPIAGHTIIGLDPGYRTGCKTAVIDARGKVLATDTLYLTGSRHQQEEAETRFVDLVRRYGATLVSIGNGTASFETEEFTSRLIAQYRLDLKYVITSEAGASVYSASELARDELPDLNVSLRGAVSIARRIEDPLAELVKIEPKAIGVGQYQHDVDQKELGKALADVVESCVNHVGVELNTASPALLGYVSGINGTIARNIIAWRNENGPFRNRKELLKVPRLGPAAFTQSAGFLRIKGGTEPLDNTPVHPESYALTEQILQELGCPKEQSDSAAVQLAAAKADPARIAAHLGAGVPTVTDILQALSRPGRDPREDSPAPMSRRHVARLSDLQIGSIVKGTVRNVVDFGCFVDIGLKINGLVHRSELTDRRINHPLDVVHTGDIVNVMIIRIDEDRERIRLSLKRVPEEARTR
ncbi:MAG TPA: RNA-binding transcriptional accessory protein [Acidaminococcaceae bacterium]|nr:RNA-binding transcriptional accessory protein [Acidaminococcaceae bacterium]